MLISFKLLFKYSYVFNFNEKNKTYFPTLFILITSTLINYKFIKMFAVSSFYLRCGLLGCLRSEKWNNHIKTLTTNLELNMLNKIEDTS